MHQKAKSVKKAAAKKSAVKKTAGKKAVTEKKVAATAKKPGFSVSNVVFLSEGVNCDGRLYLPAGIKKPPVIVMAHGIGAEMIFGLPLYAEQFVKNGYAVLMFDYRHFGESGGEPRHLISPKKQLKDWSSAIEFVHTLEKVNAERICIWGFSFSGGHVLVTAALNNKVKAFISHVPFMDSMFIVKINGLKKDLMINAAAYKDLFNSITGREPHSIPLVGREDEFAVLNTPESYEGYMSMIPQDSEWKNETPGRSMLSITLYRPFKQIGKIKCRGLVVEAELDSLADNKMVEKFFENKEQFELIKLKCGHFGLFSGEYYRKAIAAELRFLKSVFG